MPRPLRALVCLLLLLVTLPSAVTATAAGPPRADLRVTGGEVQATPGRITGSFTVRNTGTARVGPTSAAIRIDGTRVRSVRTGALASGASTVVRFSARAGSGRQVLSVCADRRKKVAESREGNNCRRLGTVTTASTSVPSDPLDHTDNVVFKVGSSPNEYWLNVPPGYDNSHRTPIRLVVFLHGCQMYANATANQVKEQMTATSLDEFILMSPGLGKDDQCWDSTADAGRLVEAIADVKTHFNIDPRRVVIGGYSSGSTLVGQVAFADAASFAGLFILPGRPFRSTDNRDQLIAAADWKLNLAWRAHRSDEFYPIDLLRLDKVALEAAGYPLAFSEVDAGHGFDGKDLDYVFSRLLAWRTPKSAAGAAPPRTRACRAPALG